MKSVAWVPMPGRPRFVWKETGEVVEVLALARTSQMVKIRSKVGGVVIVHSRALDLLPPVAID